MTDRGRVKRLVIAQGYTSLMIAVCSLPFGLSFARDALFGGMTAVLGSAVLAYWVLSCYRAAELGALVKKFYIGELARLIVIVAAFFVAIQYIEDLNPATLLVAFFIVQVIPTVLINKFID
jgi:ATP synthase protein I